jgi:hypothetical protein
MRTLRRRVRHTAGACVVAVGARAGALGARLNRTRRRVRHTAASVPASVLLLGVAVGLPFATFTAAFLVTDRLHAEVWTRKGYFLSAAIDLPPASNFGSLGLTIALTAFAAVAVVRHKIVGERLRAAGLSATLDGLHSSSLTAALTACIGGHGVAAYEHNANNVFHNGFAATFVLCALLHFHLESHLERLANISSRVARATRAALVVIATVNCAVFLSHIVRVAPFELRGVPQQRGGAAAEPQRWDRAWQVVEEMGKCPIGVGKLAAAVGEIITCGCFIAYLATYSRSFHETQITLTVAVPTAKAPPPPPTAELGEGTPLMSTLPDSPHSRLLATLRRSHSAGEALGAVVSS